MPQAEAIAPLELILNRTFNAPRERVFRAWTEAAQLDQWFAPGPGRTVKSSLDVRVGGAYRIEMRNPDGQVYVATGTYREIEPPQRLVFTWDAEGGPELVKDTLVTVELLPSEAGTDVILTHQGAFFEGADGPEMREEGWRKLLDRLTEDLTRSSA